VAEFLTKEISVDTFVNIMDQYYPAYKAFDHPEREQPRVSEKSCTENIVLML